LGCDENRKCRGFVLSSAFWSESEQIFRHSTWFYMLMFPRYLLACSPIFIWSGICSQRLFSRNHLIVQKILRKMFGCTRDKVTDFRVITLRRIWCVVHMTHGEMRRLTESFCFSIVLFRMLKLYCQRDMSCKLPEDCLYIQPFIRTETDVNLHLPSFVYAVLQKLRLMGVNRMPWYSLYACCLPERVWEIEFSKEHDEPDARQRQQTFAGESAAVSPLCCPHTLLLWTVSIHLANGVVGAKGSLCLLLGRNYIILPRTRALFYIVQFLLYAGSSLGPETGYPDWDSSCFSSLLPGTCRDTTLN
jgi:hypothetical protein